MQFIPKTEQQLEEEKNSKFAPFQPGIYSCEVVSAVEGISKSSGNPMITVELNIYNDAGETRLIRDYLMPSMEYKLRHAADAFGLSEKYETGMLNDYDFEGKTGEVKVKISKPSAYAPKNEVVDYIPKPRKAGGGSIAVSDDEIPF